MSDIEYEAWCASCSNRWYLRLSGITDPLPLVRCPRCGNGGMAQAAAWARAYAEELDKGGWTEEAARYRRQAAALEAGRDR